MVKIGVVIPARNEEAYLGKTLQHLLRQTLKPHVIIVVDDGSTDRTAEVARKYGALVVELPRRSYEALAMPELAEVINMGLKALEKAGRFDYVMVLGADHLLPRDYLEKVVGRMEMDRKLVMASGRMWGVKAYPDMPVGSGRVYRFSFLKEIGGFPLNYGWEDYPLFKALMKGYRIRCFMDIVTFPQRPIKLSKRKMLFLGMGMKALGYDPIYFLGKFILTFLKEPTSALNMLAGYLAPNVQKYHDLGDFTRRWQRRKLYMRALRVVGAQ